MAESGFHFAQPAWLLALLLPFGVWLWQRNSRTVRNTGRFKAYADRQLLPYLLGIRTASTRQLRNRLAVWTVIWSLVVLAAANPRWDYIDIQLFRPGSDLVVLLDLSGSMDATDVAPSRLGRARQEIEDLLEDNRGARIGLVAFATVAHVVSPLTEDSSNLRRQLPALSTDLVRLKGSRITEALARAQQMLTGQPRDSTQHVLLVSDGDFDEKGYVQSASNLAAAGIKVHVFGVGTAEGTTIPGAKGQPLRHPRHGVVQTRLDEEGLKALAAAGDGIYRTASYGGEDTNALLKVLAERGPAEALADQRTRVWQDRFYWLVGLVMILLLGQFRRSRVRPESSS
jgi:Ca-activated chloride channel family protein